MLDDLFVFLHIVERKSMVEAGKVLKISAATVARKLSKLEETLGVRLIDRNTRTLSLTEEGEYCYQSCKAIPSLVADMQESFDKAKKSLHGTLKISIAAYSGYQELIPKIVDFNKSYPFLKIQVFKSNVFPDLIDDSFDIYIHYKEVNTRGLQSIALIEHQMAPCATKKYLQKTAPINEPLDLMDHTCLIHQYNKYEGAAWEFIVDGKKTHTPMTSNIMFNNSALILEAMLAGGGVAYLPTYFVEGLPEVEILLKPYWPKPLPVYMTFRRKKDIFEKTKVFVDFLRQSYANQNEPTAYSI